MLPLALRYKNHILRIFDFLYFLIACYLGFGTYSFITNEGSRAAWFERGPIFGEIAAVLFIVVIVPGMLGRFRIKIQSSFILTTFRRQLGVLMFLSAFTHFYFVYFIFIISGLSTFTFNLPLFEIFSSIALLFLFMMFSTSNNFAMKTMGTWWKMLHRLVYVIVWLLFAHVAFQKISVWTVFLGSAAVIETVSLVYDWYLKRPSYVKTTAGGEGVIHNE